MNITLVLNETRPPGMPALKLLLWKKEGRQPQLISPWIAEGEGQCYFFNVLSMCKATTHFLFH